MSQKVTEIMQEKNNGALDQNGVTSRHLDDDTDTEVWRSEELNTYTFL